MAIGVQRFDVDIQLENEGKIISTGQIKAGVKIDTVKEDGRYKVIVACSGEVLGYIREEDFHCKRHEEVQGTIRSLRWNSETGNASSATIRFTKNKEATPTVGWVPPQVGDVEDTDATRLQPKQLLSMVNDPEVRRFLRDERLQHILHQIDRANDREVALAGFLESPDFQEFSNMLLKRINDA